MDMALMPVSLNNGAPRMKNTKRIISLLLTFMMVIMMAAACSKSDDAPINPPEEEPQETEVSGIENEVDPNAEIFYQPEGNGIVFEEEYEDAKIDLVKAEPSEFYGSWEATSDRAAYLYGSFEITVKEDGTWEATVSDEKLSGTWEDKGDHLHMDNDVFSFDLSYEKSGKLLLVETGSEDVFYTVLTEK